MKLKLEAITKEWTKQIREYNNERNQKWYDRQCIKLKKDGILYAEKR